MSSVDIATNVQASEINANLNTFIILAFFMGIYTVIYFGTIYNMKTSARRHLSTAALTMLYLSTITGTAVQWYFTKWDFVDNGATRQSVFLARGRSPRWALITLNTLDCITFIIADGLLIWRGFYVYNRSICMISVPLVLLVAEFALFLVKIAFSAMYSYRSISPALAVSMNDVLAAALFISFSTTLVTTVLIAHRIYSAANHIGTSGRRFRHIADIVVQSGAVYALSQLTTAIAGVVPGANTLNVVNVALDNYVQLFNFVIAGISTTVMVARVTLLSVDATYPSTSLHLSSLQFHAESTVRTDIPGVMDITRCVDQDKISFNNEQVVEFMAV